MTRLTIPRDVYNSIYIGSVAAHIANHLSLDIARRLAQEEMAAAFILEGTHEEKDDRDECIERW